MNTIRRYTRQAPMALAITAMMASLSLSVSAASNRYSPQDGSCAHVGVPCNPDIICNMNGQTTNWPYCNRDLNNICQTAPQ